MMLLMKLSIIIFIILILYNFYKYNNVIEGMDDVFYDINETPIKDCKVMDSEKVNYVYSRNTGLTKYACPDGNCISVYEKLDKKSGETDFGKYKGECCGFVWPNTEPVQYDKSLGRIFWSKSDLKNNKLGECLNLPINKLKNMTSNYTQYDKIIKYILGFLNMSSAEQTGYIKGLNSKLTKLNEKIRFDNINDELTDSDKHIDKINSKISKIDDKFIFPSKQFSLNKDTEDPKFNLKFKKTGLVDPWKYTVYSDNLKLNKIGNNNKKINDYFNNSNDIPPYDSVWTLYN